MYAISTGGLTTCVQSITAIVAGVNTSNSIQALRHTLSDCSESKWRCFVDVTHATPLVRGVTTYFHLGRVGLTDAQAYAVQNTLCGSHLVT